jgi:hypothetical protein
VLTAYAINCNVWCRAVLKIFVPARLQLSRLVYLGATLVLIVLATICSLLVPFLNALVGLVGVSCGMATTYFFPCSFALQLLNPSRMERAFLYAVLVLAALVSCFGMSASIADIVAQATAGAPV